MKIFSVALLTLLAIGCVCAAEDDHNHDDHGHGHGHSCACEAEELGFKIDCSDKDYMLQALALLQDPNNNCRTDCESDVCYKNYLIVQSHHDYCLHDEVPEPLEDGIHTFEGGCEDCAISRKPDPSLPDCPPVECDSTGDVAYQALLTSSCLSGCGGECGANYRILRAAHDTCPEDTLDPLSESGIHDFEEICEGQNCNSQTNIPVLDENGVPQLVCVKDDSVAFSMTGVPVLLLVILAAVALLA